MKHEQCNRSTFLKVVVHRLRNRWLSSPDIVSDCLVDLFGNKELEREELVSEIVVAFRNGKIGNRRSIRQTSLRRLLVRSPVIKKLFKNRDTVRVPNGLAAKLKQHTMRWPVPELATEMELVDLLQLPSPLTLDWLTLPHLRRNTPVDHYCRHSIRKRNGRQRLIERPRPKLLRTQRIITRQVLNHIPLHEAVHGFRRDCSVTTCATPHIGKVVVVRIDLQNFFGSITTARVRSLFLTAGYSKQIAERLAQLCTVPASICDDAQMRRSRLPQGAPSSPNLANAVAFQMDRRLAGLATSLGLTYTRYADDLIFSGDESFAERTQRFVTSAAAIVMEEGFEVHFHKTKIMRRAGCQNVLGLTVNDRLSTSRKDYETLKAILHNCVRFGLESQNLDGHSNFAESLRGRIAHVANVHPLRGQKLLEKFQQIAVEA